MPDFIPPSPDTIDNGDFKPPPPELLDAFTPPSPDTEEGQVLTGNSFVAKATGYYAAEDPQYMKNGVGIDRMGNPLQTLDAYRRGDAPFVTVSGDAKTFPYGTQLQSPNFPGVPFRWNDTGGDFKGKGTSRVDIARDTAAGANSDENNAPVTFTPAPMQPDGQPPPAIPPGEMPNIAMLKAGQIVPSSSLMPEGLNQWSDQPIVQIPKSVGQLAVKSLPLVNLGIAAAGAIAPKQTEAITQGAGDALVNTFNGLSTPKNVAIMATMAGAPDLIARAAALGFSAMAAKGMYDQSKQLATEPDLAKRAELMTGIVLNGAIATAAGVHGLSPKTKFPVEQPKADATNAILQKPPLTYQPFQNLPNVASSSPEASATGRGAEPAPALSPAGGTPSAGKLPQETSSPVDQEQNQTVFGFGPGAASAAENLAVAPQIKQLTETIGSQLRTPNPKNITTRFQRAAQAIGAKGVSARTAVGNAINGTRAGWLVLKNYYLNPVRSGDFWNAVKDWHFADSKASFYAREFALKLKDEIRDPLVREAITNYIQADGDVNLLQQRAQASNIKYRPGYEAATKLNDAQKTLAANVRQYFDGMLNDGINAGLLDHGLENYITQIWKRPNRITRALQADLQSGKLQTNFNYARKRVFDSFFDGEQAGFAPGSKDVAALVTTYDLSFNKSLAARAFVKALREAKASDGEAAVKFSGMSQPIQKGTEPPEAYLIRSRAIPENAQTADGRRYLPVNHPALRGWKLSVQDGEGPETFHQVDMLVHPDYAGKLSNMIEPSLLRTGVAGAITSPIFKAGALAKQTKLSLSIFHLDQEGLHGLFHQTNPVNLAKIDFENPAQAALVRGGLVVSNYDSMELFSEGLRGGGLVSKVPGLGKLQNNFNEFLFKDYIPRLKMSMALHAFERNVKRYGNEMQPDQIAEATANQANAAFGELNYKMLGRDPTLQDILRLTLLAPDFLEARTRFVGQALKPYGQEQRSALLLGAGTLYVGARALNQWLDGQPHWDKPFSVIYNGREYRLRTVMGDVVEAFTDPRRFFYNRYSPWLKTEEEIRTGRDYRGIKLEKWEIVKDALSWFVPIPIGGTEPANPVQRVLGSAGVSNKPAGTAVNDMFDSARKFRESQTDPKIQAEVARARKETYAESDYRKLILFMRDNDKESATAEMVRLMKEEGKKPHVMREYFTNLPHRPFTGSMTLEHQFLARMDTPTRARYEQARAERQKLRQQFGLLFPYAISAARQ